MARCKKWIWTAEQDAALAAVLKAGGTTTDAAQRLGCCRQHALARAKVIGLRQSRNGYVRPPSARSIYYAGALPEGRDSWWPLPAGHPVSWTCIVRGTMLEGQEYPE